MRVSRWAKAEGEQELNGVHVVCECSVVEARGGSAWRSIGRGACLYEGTCNREQAGIHALALRGGAIEDRRECIFPPPVQLREVGQLIGFSESCLLG